MKPSFSKTQSSVLLDLVRGLAALLVLLEHWRNFLFVDYSQLPAHRILFAPLYLLCAAGHQAVVIFFVLSGYLISGSIFRTHDRGTWSWPTYLTHRLVRLWVVLLPGLLLCALLDTVGLRSHLAPALYAGAVVNHQTHNVAQVLTFKTFFENLFFLQGITGPIFGSDGALWSLANELWYYILFPLGLLTLRRRVTLAGRTLGAGFFLLIAWFVGWPILSGFPIWLAGTLLCLIPPPRCGGLARSLAAILYVPLLFFFARQTRFPLSPLASDYLLAAATFFFLWVMLSAVHPARNSLATDTSQRLARFSYTLYVVHMPFLLLLTAITAGDTRWLPDALHLVKAAVILLLAIAYAYAVAMATEFRTDALRRRIEPVIVSLTTRKTRRLPQRSPAALSPTTAPLQKSA